MSEDASGPAKERRFFLKNAAATRRLGVALGRLLRAGDVLGLDGPLGAGKTSLVQGLALGLGVPKEVRVNSPSFTLINEYAGRVPLYHADLYRLERAGELSELGLWELAQAGGVLCIEWLSRFPQAAPDDRLQADLTFPPKGGRAVRLRALGPAAAARLHEISAGLGDRFPVPVPGEAAP